MVRDLLEYDRWGLSRLFVEGVWSYHHRVSPQVVLVSPRLHVQYSSPITGHRSPALLSCVLGSQVFS